MKRVLLFTGLVACSFFTQAQEDRSKETSPDALLATSRAGAAGDFINIKRNAATPVKNQAKTGTCWSFSTTSLIESQAIKNKLGTYDISEMYTVRHIYLQKAKNYVLRQGKTQFSEGALGHDVINAMAQYGAVPENVYPGLPGGEAMHDHEVLQKQLIKYVDSVVKSPVKPIDPNWINGYNKILDQYLGVVPQGFKFNNRQYNPENFAKEALQFKASDYVNITSFTHHPYYAPFVLEVPDNFSNGAYYNVPLTEMISLVSTALNNGFTIMWDADVSNNGFKQSLSVANIC